MKQNEPPPPVDCDGVGHVWQILPAIDGEPGRAVGRCCGVRAVIVRGVWALEEEATDDV
ncbi:hypothetical protein [Sphingomonas montana]|uniref:hypothetical protein n=1 Tax=Sphingomonas montana TaxID=1843236 RepID=UPI0013ED72C9|nr:hypothetical protein [Sphingomonas montana]